MRVCLKRKEHDSPIRTPTEVDAREMVKKLQRVDGRVLAVNDSFSEYSRRKVRKSTIATASLRTLSPNTKLARADRGNEKGKNKTVSDQSKTHTHAGQRTQQCTHDGKEEMILAKTVVEQSFITDAF